MTEVSIWTTSVRRSTVAMAVLLATSVGAQAQQVIGIRVGQFRVPVEDRGRDVLRTNSDFLAFDISELNGTTFGGDWMLAFGQYAEAGIGLEFYQNTVSTSYREWFNDGSEIELDLTLRTVSVPLTARFFPTGRDAGIQPYFGGGLAIHFWRYTESGELLDFSDFVFTNVPALLSGEFIDQGVTFGPLVFGGIRIPVGLVHLGGELRYRLNTESQLSGPVFAATTLDIGGMSLLATVQFKIP